MFFALFCYFSSWAFSLLDLWFVVGNLFAADAVLGCRRSIGPLFMESG